MPTRHSFGHYNRGIVKSSLSHIVLMNNDVEDDYENRFSTNFGSKHTNKEYDKKTN